MSSDCVYSPSGLGETENTPSDGEQGHAVQRLYPELPLTDENSAQSNVGSSTVGHGSSTVGRGSWKQTAVSQPPHPLYSETLMANASSVGSGSRRQTAMYEQYPSIPPVAPRQTAVSQYPGQAHRAQVPMYEQYPSIPPVVPLECEGIPQLDVAPGNNIPPTSTYTNDPYDEGNISRQGAGTTAAGTDYWEGSTSGVIFDSKSKANDNNISVGNSDRSIDGNDFDRDRQRSLDASEGGPSASGSSMSSNYDEIGDNESRDTAFKNDNQVFRKKGIDADWVTNVDDLYEKACEKYVYFWKKDMVFSQWHWSVFVGEGGQEFNCAEQYMMFRKAEIFDDYPIQQKILRAKHPPKIKALGRKVHNFNEEVWSSQCLHIVKQANIAKFSQNPRMKTKLFNTYPKLLAEASPVDAVWGIGHDKYDEEAWDETKWRGRNLLGYILTEVRDELLCDEGFIQKEDKKVYLQKLQEDNNAIQMKRRQEQEGTPV